MGRQLQGAIRRRPSIFGEGGTECLGRSNHQIVLRRRGDVQLAGPGCLAAPWRYLTGHALQ
jgi:hypothetical protein